MTHASPRPRTAWMDVAPLELPPLDRDCTADVCIIGAGISGIATAYRLVREGHSVVVVDDGPVGAGMTQRTTAHLSNAVDDRYIEIERHHGLEGARIAAESHTAAIDEIERTVAAEGIDCDFERVDGYLFSPPGAPPELLTDELAAAHRAGLERVEEVTLQPIGAKLLDRCLRFPRQAQFHPIKYLSAVAQAVVRGGGRVCCGTHASTVEGGRAARVTTADGHTISAGAVVVATNTPINDVIAIHTKQAPYSTYVVALSQPASAGERALFWDTEDPYHYVRLQRHSRDGYDLLIVGGEDHKSGQADDGELRLERLERWARAYFPLAEDVELRWSGQVMEPVDGVAFIGRNPGDEDNVYIATGDSGMGMTHGTIAGTLLTDLILERASAWEKLYDPSRKMLREAVEYAKENANVAAQYLKDYVSGGDVTSVEQIARGHGAVLRRGLKKIAVFRDGDGRLYERSAVCPHLGCVVSFDAIERTWNCPCHGSRFDGFGRVIVGPANRDLATLDS